MHLENTVSDSNTLNPANPSGELSNHVQNIHNDAWPQHVDSVSNTAPAKDLPGGWPKGGCIIDSLPTVEDKKGYAVPGDNNNNKTTDAAVDMVQKTAEQDGKNVVDWSRERGTGSRLSSDLLPQIEIHGNLPKGTDK